VQKPSPPNGVYVLTVIAMLLGIGFVLGGGTWITTAVRQSFSALALVGVVFLLVGILDIIVGVSFFWARPWSWAWGILASIVTGIFSVLEVNVQGQSLSVGVGVNATSIVRIVFPLAISYYLTTSSVKSYLSSKSVSC
jgi:hypothetical protein